VRLRELTAQQVQQFYAGRLAAGLSSSTVHHLHETLHKALKDAERLGLVSRNVTKMVNPPRMASAEIHPLSREEAQILLDVANGERCRRYISLLSPPACARASCWACAGAILIWTRSRWDLSVCVLPLQPIFSVL